MKVLKCLIGCCFPVNFTFVFIMNFGFYAIFLWSRSPGEKSERVTLAKSLFSERRDGEV